MTRRAKQPEPVFSYIDLAGQTADLAGRKIAENPALVGGTVAFAVIMFFVSSNALFYQPFRHTDALFETRSMDTYSAPELPTPVSLKAGKLPAQTLEVADDGAGLKARAKDIQLIDIQTALAKLKLYSGTIDGVPGPKTRAAIQQFQQQAGLEPTGDVDPLLIDAIRTASIPDQNIPKPVIRQPEGGSVSSESNDGSLTEDEVRKLQAGLKAFGNDNIEIDGKLGSKTKTAIIEFQRLFQLSESGEANRETLAKLQELGLVSG